MSATAIPVSVTKVRRLMLLYAAAILLSTLVFAVDTGFMEKRELFRGLLRVAGFSYLAWWLPSLDKRAWWTSVIACGLLSAIGLVALLLVVVGLDNGSSVLWALAKMAVPLYALGHAFLILVQSETRWHFEA